MFALRILAAGFAVASFGCLGTPLQPTARPQANDDPAEKMATARIGDKTVVGNVEPMAVSAVGLVWKLNGTGSPAGGEWRALLERDLRKKKLPNIQQYLDDPNRTTSLVLVSAVIPPGSKRGDPVDIDVTLPRGSGTTSLKDGCLLECDLTTTEESGNIRNAMKSAGAEVGPTPVMGNTLLIGKTLVRAEGPLVVSCDARTAKLKASIADGDPTEGWNVGRIWGGGRCLEDRPYYFVLNDKNSRVAMEIAERLNTTFQQGGDPRHKVANAVNSSVVCISVPPAYRLNHPRFLIVARQVPLLPAAPNSRYRDTLEKELLEPATAISAAVKLEALGVESQQPLRVALQSQSPWVRFAAAEALAYLGNTTAAAELGRLAEQHPALRTHCLLALATLDDGVSTDRLIELMGHPDNQVRYGAFTALRLANERQAALNGKHVQKTFWVHTVAPESPPLVHLASYKRAEIVLFGKVGELLPPFSFPLGREFTITAQAGDVQATITRIVTGADEAKPVQVKSSLALSSMLAAVGEMGGGYAEAIELVLRADKARVLASKVAIDAAPLEIPIAKLAELAHSEGNLERANLEVERFARGEGDGLGNLDLPNFDEVKPAVKPQPAALSRSPGRLFAAKKHPMDPDEDPAPAPAPAPAAADDNSLSRTQGHLFGK